MMFPFRFLISSVNEMGVGQSPFICISSVWVSPYVYLVVGLRECDPGPLPYLGVSDLIGHLGACSYFSTKVPRPISMVLAGGVFHLLSFQRLELVGP